MPSLLFNGIVMSKSDVIAGVGCPRCGASAGRECLLDRPRRDGRTTRDRAHQERWNAFASSLGGTYDWR
jgi:hypothetical protein